MPELGGSITQYGILFQNVIAARCQGRMPDSDPFSDSERGAEVRVEAPLMSIEDLKAVFVLKFADPEDRWTYHYQENEQIDYFLVSEHLRTIWQNFGVNRRGIHKVQEYTNGATLPYKSVTHYANSASDHGAVWADFKLD